MLLTQFWGCKMSKISGFCGIVNLILGINGLVNYGTDGVYFILSVLQIAYFVWTIPDIKALFIEPKLTKNGELK